MDLPFDLTNRGTYFQPWDEGYAWATAHGIDVIYITPSYIDQPRTATTFDDIQTINTLAAFAGNCAARYPKAAFEVMNEPDVQQGSNAAITVNQYITYAQAVSAAIRNVSTTSVSVKNAPGNLIISGGIQTPGFLQAVLPQIGGGVDAIGWHPYRAPFPGFALPKPLFITEWGTNVPNQIEQVTEMNNTAIATSKAASAFVYFCLIDGQQGGASNFGLIDAAGNRKAAFATLQTLAKHR
jgi:hypothetical protein